MAGWEYNENMTVILLAAGLSSRMGRNKLLLPYRGRTVIENTLLSVLDISDRIIVVTGNGKENIEGILKDYPVDFIYNADYESGQRVSTLKGIEAVGDDDFAVLPSDLPLLEKNDVKALFTALENADIVRPSHHGIPGHPVCYRRENRKRLLQWDGTMKEYLKREGFITIPSPLGCVYDVDTPQRYSALSAFDGNLSVLESYID